jgi:hypothetical protein
VNELNRFEEVWAVDFEYPTDPDLHPDPLCMVATGLRSGRTIRLWRDELRTLRRAPFDTGPLSLMLAYSATAELDCFLSLGWPLPCNVIDLYVEYLAINNPTPRNARGLVAALAAYGLGHLAGSVKAEMQEKAMTQTEWPESERIAMLDYCAEDSIALRGLLEAMLPQLDIPLALMRGRYMKAVARMVRIGVPIDAELYHALVRHWEDIKQFFIARDGAAFDVYDGTTFKQEKFAAYLARHEIYWTVTPSGRLATDHKTWRERTRVHPELTALKDLVANITDLRISAMPVGADGRARCWLAPFWTATGRNQPSPSQFIFAMPGWLRALIMPPPGHGIAYLDFASQEVAIVAALSGDAAMLADVRSGDPYLAFGRRARLIPESATKQSHKAERDQLKRAVLGPTYGMTEYGLAALLKIPRSRARELLARQRTLYGTLHAWMQNAVATAQFSGQVTTPFGWSMRVGPETKTRTIMNFYAQASGSEMMRAAAIAATEAGIQICCPVHDAFLIQAPLNELDDAIKTMRELMAKAALVVTGGLPVEIEEDTVVRWPDRFPSRAKEGRNTWGDVMGVLQRLGEKVA